MSQIGSPWRPARSPLAGLWSDVAGAVRSAILTYFDLFANGLAISQRHPGSTNPGRPGADRCADAAGALSWAAETYRVLARDAKAYNNAWIEGQQDAPPACQTEERDVRETL